MPTFIVSADGGKFYRMEAFNAFEAWEAAFKAHPDAKRIVLLPLPLRTEAVARPLGRAQLVDSLPHFRKE